MGEESEGGEAGTGKNRYWRRGVKGGVLHELWALAGCERLPQHRGVPAAGKLPRSGGGGDLEGGWSSRQRIAA